MTERISISEQKTAVGIPFYDGEGPGVLESCLKDTDKCLNHLGIDAQIVVGINGPRVSHGEHPLSHEINRSGYNADIKFINPSSPIFPYPIWSCLSLRPPSSILESLA